METNKNSRIVLASASKFKVLRGKRGLRINLGCGTDIKSGWVNIDLKLKPPVIDKSAAPDTIYINHDLRRGLPLDGKTCAMIYSSHFFEHLDYRDAVPLLRECYRILQSGGVFRAALPDFKYAFQAYLRGDIDCFKKAFDIFKLVPQLKPGTETLADYMSYCIFQSGEHKWMMDQEKMLVLLRHIGFESVAVTPFRADVDINTELRRSGSFYIEAVK